MQRCQNLSNNGAPLVDGQFTATHAENSDVVPLMSADVAVMAFVATKPETGTLNDALPLASVVTDVDPRKVAPSPFPLPLQDVFEKNSIVNVALAVLFNVPIMVGVADCAEVMTGKLLAPPGWFALTTPVAG